MSTKFTRMARAIAGMVALAGSLWAGGAQAVLIPPSVTPAPYPGMTNGLNGRFYDTGIVGSNAAADILSAAPPTATFHSTVVDYPSGAGTTVSDGTTLATYLGADGASLSGAGGATLTGSVFRFDGFIFITSDLDQTPGDGIIDILFSVGSDDGMRLRIGGVTVTEFATPRAFGVSSGTASFSSEGLYALDLLYWEDAGVTGVEMSWTTGAATTPSIIPNERLFVPVPGSALLLGAGLLALGGARRRRG